MWFASFRLDWIKCEAHKMCVFWQYNENVSIEISVCWVCTFDVQFWLHHRILHYCQDSLTYTDGYKKENYWIFWNMLDWKIDIIEFELEVRQTPTSTPSTHNLITERYWRKACLFLRTYISTCIDTHTHTHLLKVHGEPRVFHIKSSKFWLLQIFEKLMSKTQNLHFPWIFNDFIKKSYPLC